MRPLLKNLKLVASSTCVYAFCVLFPTVASCSESGKSIDDVLPPIEADSSSTAIEHRIVMVEQSQHQVIIVDRESGETLWTWNAAQSGLSREEQKWFELPDEVKPIYNGKYLLVTGTRGGVGIVRISDKKMMFYAEPKGSPHSAELLPDGNVVVACSDDPEGNKLALYRVDTLSPLAKEPLHEYELYFGHNAVWDKNREVLWATAGDELRSYTYEDENLTLQEVYALPSGEKDAHDLFPVYGEENLLWLTTTTGVFQFDTDSKQFTKQDVNPSTNIKSISNGPEDYPIIMLQPTESWWSHHMLDSFKHVIYNHTGYQIYKGRWMLDNVFSYPETHDFIQPKH